MFRWNIAKSAEAIFSRWAIKRVCKFLLKKKLGQFILGDIDLNQLDVQLTAGTIQLSDLALNVDYLNQKFGAEAAIYVKEGSIGSLLVTMPWKGKGCEVEVEELELVLAPCGRLDHQFGYESCISRPDGNNCSNLHDTEKVEHDKAESAITSSSIDVHEGVKTIAKFVKWLLTSFHVRVRKLIVAFDSLLLENEKSTELQRTLVLRFTEVEFGACISEEFSSDAGATGANFLGLNRLTNFVKFKGAMLEFLHMNGEENDNLFSSDRERTFAEFFSTCCPSTARTPVLTGERDGISGTLKLSIPWKNGSLNIRKVEADAYIDPLELKFQPSSIKWFLCLWDIVNNVDKNGKTSADSMTMGSVYSTATSHYSSSWGSTTPPNDKALGQNERPAACCSPVGKEVIADALLPESRLISDWVRFATNNSIQKDGTGEEPDFGASVEQFFECFDGMRNSQSALGNSGMWNWTCSVFSAITAASSLASGSLQVPCEQQHVETNLKATIAGVSVLFSLTDGVQPNSSQQKSNQVDMGPRAHYLMSSFRGIHLIMQVCPQDVNFGAKVESIDLTDGFTYGDDELEFGMHDRSDVEDQMLKIQQMQVVVEDALPPFFPSAKNAGPGGRKNCECIFRDDVVKASLFKTSGATEFQLTVHSGSSAVKLTGPTSFSLKFPPFNLWVNFHLINMIAGLFKDSIEMGSTRCLHSSKDFSSKDSSSHGDLKRSSHSLSSNELMRGVMFLPAARIILCFPCGNDEDLRNYYSFDQFIVLDFSSPSPLNEGNAHVSTPTLNASPYKRDSPEISRSLHLNMGNLDIYLLSSTSNSNAELVAGKVLSARSRSGNLSIMSLLWQEDSVADHELIKKAKLLATAEDSRGRSRHVGKGYEFASVTTAKDVEDSSNCIRRDMISSSSFFLHACLSPLKINLSSSQYKVLHSLLLHAIDKLVPNENKNEPSLSQTSILVDCDSAEISVSLEMDESVKGSIEKELAGSWHHFRLQIKKFQLLSVSNIGGISGANFLWAAHGEGNLWGSITGVPEEELLLITCSNSAMGRGDGEGSNVLSSKFSGSDIIHLWDPDSSHDYMSITIRCGTIVAMGGRLDWFERVSSFFCLQSSEIEQTSEHGSKKRTPIENISCESSFILNLVDVGLSYEPYIKGLLAGELSHSEFSTRKAQGNNTSFVACLLAASSVKLSNSKLTDYIDSDYKIVAQDLGLLLCTVSGREKIIDIYSTEHLHKAGYVKVARDPHIEAILRIFSADAPRWKLDCSGSHILLDSCHDTTSGLIRLLSQLQQLFAPDLEESFVHLQNRWNNVQKAQRSDGKRTHSSGDFAPLTSQVETSHLNTRIDPGAVNLMDEISEDEFHFDRFLNALSDSSESEFYVPVDETINVSDGSRPLFLQESFLEFIEGYFLTELSPTPELFVEKQPSKNVPICKPKNTKMADAEKAKNGWYGDNSLIIMDNHVSDVNTQTHLQQLVADEATTSNCNKTDGYDRLRGCISFNNISICWKMYAGSDWHKFQESVQHSASPGGRDRTTCLELVLSGAGFKYEIYPEGEIRVSRLCLTVQDFLLNDTSHEAPWKLVLGYYQSKDHPRKSLSKAFKLDLESVRPDPLTPLEEYRLRIAFLPMLLHLHQSQLDFLISFFGGKDSSAELASNAAQDLGGIDIVSKNGSTFNVHSISEEALLPYFQKFDLWPVLVRVDYIPCRVDLAALKGGKYVELVNLVPWKGVELKLKPVHSVGVYGWSSVCETIIGEWLEDISQNQVHKLLQGLPPIRSLVAVGSGATKLVTLPMESYKKDHRVLKGMQRGITAFLRSISLEAVGLGVHLAAGAHDILLQAEYVLTSIPPSVCRTKTNVRSNQPENARQGIKQACKSIGDGLSKTTTALVRTPLKKYQRGGGAGSALATAIQAAPAAAIAPASATARAVHCALLGVRNSLDPEHKKESIEKYLGATQLREKFAEG